MDEQAEERDAESVASLERGGLPVTAGQRLRAAREGRGAWTSDLSTPELAAVLGAGFHPLGMVMGSSVYRVGAAAWASYSSYSGYGAQPRAFGYGYGLDQHGYERGIGEARDLAIGRMREEAALLGAHGVVGVRLIYRQVEGVGQTVEFTAIGTAVHRASAPPLPAAFTSHLSGQDFGKLIAGGYAPCGLVAGIRAIATVSGGGFSGRMGGAWEPFEVDLYTDAAERSRAGGIADARRQAKDLDADGIVGVEVHAAAHEVAEGTTLWECFVVGTAVRRFAAEPMPVPPLPIVRLIDR